MPSPLRQKRVADRLQAEISQLLQHEMNDPRLNLVTVTQINIDRELEHANVFVSTVGDETRRKEVLQALQRAQGFIRREVAQRLQLRRAPVILFHWDFAPEKAEQVEQLLDQIVAQPRVGAQTPTVPAETPAPATTDTPDE